MHSKQSHRGWLIPLALVALFMVTLQANVHAGSPEDPEITDADNDTTGSDGDQDIVRAWIQESTEFPGSLEFFVESKGNFEHPPSYYANHVRYSFRFTPSNPDGLPSGAAEAYINLRPTRSAPAPNVYVGDDTLECRFGFAPTPGGSADLESEGEIASIFEDGNLFGCRLGFGQLGSFGPGHSITAPYVLLQEVTRGPTSGGDEIPVTVRNTWDRAPDDGFGRPFQIPLPPQPDELGETWQDLTGNTTSISDAFTQPNGTNAIRHYNWSAPEAVQITYTADNVTNGSVTLTIIDLLEETLLKATLTGNHTETVLLENITAGMWSITTNYNLYVGNFNVTLQPPGLTDSLVPKQSDGHDHDHDENEAPAGKGKQSPGPSYIGLAIMLLVAVAMRRRN